LRLQGDVSDLVQENRAAIRDFKTALFAVLRAGEGALFVAEKFTFKERFGERAAVKSHKRV
jgi:hypothetical protein